MDALTAGVALASVYGCVAIVMTGLHLATRTERSTRYWALASGMAGLGLLTIVTTHASNPTPWALAFGNNLLIIGLLFEWWGLQLFRGRSPSRLGLFIAAGFFMLYAALLLSHASIEQRSLLSSVTVTLVYGLCLYELLALTRKQRFTAASVIGLLGLAVLILISLIRALLMAQGNATYVPTSSATLGVIVVFLLPLIGKLLFSSALVLLYFERIVASHRQIARHDELTGLMNRRALYSAGQRELALAQRLQQPVAVAFVDIDFFKSINDKLGHRMGDEVLKMVASTLLETTREFDVISRYGGDEFCLVLPGLRYPEAVDVGSRLVDAVHGASLHGTTVSISVGIAVLDFGGDATWEDMLQTADKALYAAKEAGRNRSTVRSAVPAVSAGSPV